MPMTALTGSRLRERRLQLGLRQADVARAAGISASYLNLIEHNRRRIGADVMERLAQALGVPIATLAEGAAGALIEDLRAAAASAVAVGAGAGAGMQVGVAAGPQAEVDRLDDFAGRFPGWARTLAMLHRRAQGLERVVEALNDRMTHDPHLSASLHEVLSAVSSVRSTAAILAETEDIDPDWRARFHRNLHQDSERLALGAEALVAYLDASGQADEQGIASPQEELEAWLAAQDWRPGEAPGAAETTAAAPLASAAARSLARAWTEQAARDAAALPQAALAAAVARYGPDPLRLAAEFGADVMAVFRRLATAPGSDLGLVICDGSGTLTFRKPAAGFALPRFGAACPLWPLYSALSRPEGPVEAVVETADRPARRFRALAFCRTRHPEGFAGPQVREAAMLIVPGAGEAVAGSPVLPVGSSCRICPRPACAARREPSILSEARG
jgi:predicted transcriptional regulator/DNA-binding XRE family transcriptional regulator